MKRNFKLYNRSTIYAILILTVLYSCSGDKSVKLYHKFSDNQWQRFNFLRFEFPVEEAGKTYDIIMLTTFSATYQYENLDFNMNLKSPAGEERIMEYQMKVKSKDGEFLNEIRGDSCQVSMTLKRQLKIGKQGILKIEIENLIPRMTTEGIQGISVIMVPSGE
jgi:gliding motility-associated lipoprotein GldH